MQTDPLPYCYAEKGLGIMHLGCSRRMWCGSLITIIIGAHSLQDTVTASNHSAFVQSYYKHFELERRPLIPPRLPLKTAKKNVKKKKKFTKTNPQNCGARRFT